MPPGWVTYATNALDKGDPRKALVYAVLAVAQELRNLNRENNPITKGTNHR